MKSLFPILLWTFVTQIGNSVEIGQRDERRGYCTTMVSYRESRSIPYMETYRERTWGIFYKTKFRWNYKIEYYTAWRPEERCCFLYERRRDECVPVCFRDCGNGDCVSPNVCECHYGYAETASSQGPVCVPECKRSCANGRCTAPNVCTCNAGHRIGQDGFTCEPICTPDCDRKSALCSAPNTCSCRDGYRKVGYATCLPICQRGCENGRCTAPDVCACDDGYSLDPDDEFTCKPICDECTGGLCTAPAVCTCPNGYSLSSEAVCEPICSEPCRMGTCVAPETCLCRDGYGFFNDSTYVCEPICPKACINGYCVRPNACECHDGFVVTGDETSLHACKPRCVIPCEPNGECTAPDVCTCHEGYSLEGDVDTFHGAIRFDGASICNPICEKECVNGFCDAPERCACWDGFEPSDEVNVCKPICEPSCWSRSSCTAPNRCNCDKGYELSIGNDESGKFCEPICEQECVKGFCSSPNECTCEPGYVNDEKGSCVPRCKIDCGNGTCVEPDTCSCNEGYALANLSRTCEPYCEGNCDNGDCVAPGVCRCHVGFLFKNDNDNNDTAPAPTCVSACKDACNERGDCVAVALDERANCNCFFGWSGTDCVEPTVCVVVVLEGYQIYDTLSFVKKPNYSMIFASVTNPACQQCLNEVDNRTICYEFQYTEDLGKRNYSAICFVDASSMCYATHSPTKEVLKVSVAVGGLAVLIMIASIAVACFKFKKQKETVVIGKSSKTETSRRNLLSEDNTNL